MKRNQHMLLWQKILALAACASICLTGCGMGDSASGESASKNSLAFMQQTNNLSGNADASYEETTEDGMSFSESEQDAASSDDNKTKDNVSSGQAGQEPQALKKEMLVYRGTLSIDTLNFSQSVTAFKKQIEKAGGFIESETFSDDTNVYDDYDYYYAVEESDKHNIFTATVRVPSSKYNVVMDSAGDIGDLRGKQSNAENVTQNYSTYQAELKVYETEHKRYLKLLEAAKEEKYALQLEEKIFDLQIKIADLKSKITNIETDVAYSYIDITIREVVKYQSEIEETDTFWQRLKETCSDSWINFLTVLENILFLLIHIWYYIAIALAVVFFVLRINKRKRSQRKMMGTTAENQISPENIDLPEKSDNSDNPSDNSADK